VAKTAEKSFAESSVDLAPFAAELRGVVMLEAMVAALAVVSYADQVSSLIERWRVLGVVAGDPLLAVLPKVAIAEEWAMHRRAFTADPAAARKAALRQVARLASEPRKAPAYRMQVGTSVPI